MKNGAKKSPIEQRIGKPPNMTAIIKFRYDFIRLNEIEPILSAQSSE